MGRLKQLLPLGEKTFFRHCLDSLVASGVEDIAVVLGPQHEKMKEELGGYPVQTAINRRETSDMAESVRLGLAAVDGSATGILICLSDHPLVTEETLKVLVKAHAEDPEKIIVPVYRGKRGHPSLFPGGIIKEIFSGSKLRDIVRRDAGRVMLVDVTDEGVVTDIDTMEDYEAVLRDKGAVSDVKGT